MRREVISVMMGLFAAVVFAMTGCGGGSGSSTTPTTQTPTTVSTANFSAKSFATEGGTVTFNANGTLSSVGFDTSNQTWAVNSSGQLMIYGTSKGTATLTLRGDATNGWTGSMAYANGTNETLTLTPVTSPATNRYIVSGTITSGGVGLAGVTLQYGIGAYTATTDNNGNYSFNTTPNGSSSISASKNGYTFTPATQPVTVNGANITGINFTATTTTVSTTGFTTTMLSGKTFSDSQGSVMTFNTNGTFLQSGHSENMTWSINSSGQLVVAGMTINLISGSLTTGLVYSDSNSSSNHGTLTLVNSSTTTTGFSTVMINGRNFQFVTPDSSGSITFNSNNTISATKSASSGGGTSGGTWSINSSGQLIVFYTADNGTYTMTLISKTATSITATESWTKSSGNGSDTITFGGTVGS